MRSEVGLEHEVKLIDSPIKFANKICPLVFPNWIRLDRWQEHLLLNNDRYIIINASRQSGKSTILAVKAAYLALTKPYSLILLVAEQRQSNEDIRKVRDILKAYDKHLRAKYEGKMMVGFTTDNKTSLELSHGSRVIALPGNERVRGYSAPDLVIMDEAAYLDDEVFVGIDPMLEVSHGQLILASTPNGNQGFFYKEWDNPRYTRYRIPWHDCPRIKKESIEQKRIVYGDAYVKQEYGTQFLDELTSLFTERALQESIEEEEEVLIDAIKTIRKTLDPEVQLI